MKRMCHLKIRRVGTLEPTKRTIRDGKVEWRKENMKRKEPEGITGMEINGYDITTKEKAKVRDQGDRES